MFGCVMLILNQCVNEFFETCKLSITFYLIKRNILYWVSIFKFFQKNVNEKFTFVPTLSTFLLLSLLANNIEFCFDRPKSLTRSLTSFWLNSFDTSDCSKRKSSVWIFIRNSWFCNIICCFFKHRMGNAFYWILLELA